MFKEIKTAETYLKVLEALETKVTAIGGKERLATYATQFRQIIADAKKLDAEVRILASEAGTDFDELTKDLVTKE